MRRVSWASTSFWLSWRGLATASRIASLVISWNTMRLTGIFGFRTSWRCQAIASPSRSSSVARNSSSESFSRSLSFLTWAFLSALIT